jgi:serine phosphatase RsbU (regulator of sigma subunit)
MYGQEKLKDLFSSNSDKNILEIKNEILNSLREYECNDDVTMVIIRRTG